MGAQEEFQALALDHYEHWYRLNPVEASWLGIHAYDDMLGDYDAGSVVQCSGNAWYATIRSTGVRPSTVDGYASNCWELFVARGRQGKTGQGAPR